MSGNSIESRKSDDVLVAISDLHAQHYQKATPVQKKLDRVLARLSHPALLIGLLGSSFLWISGNLIVGWSGGQPFDEPPFEGLQGIASVMAVYLAALILTTQRREDDLSRHRDQLTLELAILTERKTTKLIELLEEMRRDNPLVEDRIDDLAEAMAKPTDPMAVLSAIEDVQRLSDQ